MSVREIVSEIVATLDDIVAQGDPVGHLVALWEVLTGRVQVGDGMEVAQS